MASTTSIEDFISSALELAEDASEGRAIKEAARNGFVKTPDYHRDPAPGYDGEIRQMASQVVIGIWNRERRSVQLAEIYQGVREKVHRRIEDGDWPKIWVIPSRRTCDRRVNEAADYRFYEGTTPIICLKAGWYQANPALFEESVVSDILNTQGERTSTRGTISQAAPPIPHPKEDGKV